MCPIGGASVFICQTNKLRARQTEREFLNQWEGVRGSVGGEVEVGEGWLLGRCSWNEVAACFGLGAGHLALE